MNTTNKILLIYTGGTIGMKPKSAGGTLIPVDFDNVEKEFPEIKRFPFHVETLSFQPPIDSCSMTPQHWVQLGQLIFDNYDIYVGFVVLHGTDTMAYTSSALSFMFENLCKPIIFTGAQLPISQLRTDAKDNLISALEIAGEQEYKLEKFSEVGIYFNNTLYRANRTTKSSTEYFNAFTSPNFPCLAQTGIHIRYHHHLMLPSIKEKPLRFFPALSKQVHVLKIYPGLQQEVVEFVCNHKNSAAIVLETFGVGNVQQEKWLYKELENAILKHKLIVNVSQCLQGGVYQEKYDGGNALKNRGVISGFDSTTEAAVTKLMHLLGQKLNTVQMNRFLNTSIRGEITVN